MYPLPLHLQYNQPRLPGRFESLVENGQEKQISETANRPPGESTRYASRNTCPLSADKLITQFEMTTSTALSGNGIFSITPFRKRTFSIFASTRLRSASSSIASVISSP